MIHLRNYQQKTIDALRTAIKNGNTKLIMCAPTGSGKTVMFSFMLKSAIERGKKCMVLTHRTELLSQAGGILSNLGCELVNLDAKLKVLPDANLYVAMTQTLARRINKPEYQSLLSKIDLIIIDESHLQSFNSLLDHTNGIVIGATATPIRSGNQASLDEFYQTIIEECTISQLIADGYLAKPNYYGFKIDLKGIKTKGGDYDSESLGDYMNRNKIFNGVFENYQRLTHNKKAIIFSPNVSSSQKLVAELQNKGLPIKHIDANTNNRAEILNWFENTPNALLSNVGILTAGYDHDKIDVVILYRATKSLPLYLQMVGRGSRVHKTKKEFTILDFGNNIYTHDFWHIDRVWKLEKEVKEKGVAPVKSCKNCDAILPAVAKFCEYCGAEQPKTPEQIKEELTIELSKITPEDISQYFKVKNWEKLEQFAEYKGYKRSWLHYKLPLDQLNDYANYKGYNPNWVNQIKILRNGR
jgi:superfamily II DNA or RNA helicase